MSSTTVMLLPVIRKRRKNIEKMNIKPQNSYHNIRQNNYKIFNCILCDKTSHLPYLFIPNVFPEFPFNSIEMLSMRVLPCFRNTYKRAYGISLPKTSHGTFRCLAQRLDQSVTYHLHIYGLVSYVTK